MFLLDPLPRALTYLFIFASMLSIGLQTTRPGMLALFLDRRLLARSLAANFVLIPALGVLCALFLPVSPEVGAAFVLLGCAPGGVSAIQFTGKVRGAAEVAGGMVFLLSILAIPFTPLLIRLVLPDDVPVAVPYGRVFAFAALFLVLPLFGGMLLRPLFGAWSARLSRPLAIVGTAAFAAVVGLIFGYRKQAMSAIGAPAAGFMLLFVLTTMATGWLMGGPSRATRRVMATTASMRNVALCLLLALSAFPGGSVQAPLVAFSALMIPPNLIFALYFLVRRGRKEDAIDE